MGLKNFASADEQTMSLYQSIIICINALYCFMRVPSFEWTLIRYCHFNTYTGCHTECTKPCTFHSSTVAMNPAKATAVDGQHSSI